jgi:hypothetical protein
LDFEKEANFFRRKLVKIAEISDQKIDPGTSMERYTKYGLDVREMKGQNQEVAL